MSDDEYEILGTSSKLSLQSDFELIKESIDPYRANPVDHPSNPPKTDISTNDSAIDSTTSSSETATTSKTVSSSGESNITDSSSSTEQTDEVHKEENLNNFENNENKMNSTEVFNNFMKPLPDVDAKIEENSLDHSSSKLDDMLLNIMDENIAMKELLKRNFEVLPQFLRKLKNDQQSSFDQMKNYIDKKFSEEFKREKNKSDCANDNIEAEHIDTTNTHNICNKHSEKIKHLEGQLSKARVEIFEINEKLRTKDVLYESTDYDNISRENGIKNIQYCITEINSKIIEINEKIDELEGVQEAMSSFENKIAADVNKIIVTRDIDMQYLQQQIDEQKNKMSDISNSKPTSTEDESVLTSSLKINEKVIAIQKCEKMLEEFNLLKKEMQNVLESNTASKISNENVPKIQKEIEELQRDNKKLLETALKKFEEKEEKKKINQTNDKSNSSSPNHQEDTKVKKTNSTTNRFQPSTSSAENQGGSLSKCPICYDAFDSEEIYKSHYDICFELNSKQDQNIILGNRNSEERVIWIDNSAN